MATQPSKLHSVVQHSASDVLGMWLQRHLERAQAVHVQAMSDQQWKQEVLDDSQAAEAVATGAHTGHSQRSTRKFTTA